MPLPGPAGLPGAALVAAVRGRRLARRVSPDAGGTAAALAANVVSTARPAVAGGPDFAANGSICPPAIRPTRYGASLRARCPRALPPAFAASRAKARAVGMKKAHRRRSEKPKSTGRWAGRASIAASAGSRTCAARRLTFLQAAPKALDGWPGEGGGAPVENAGFARLAPGRFPCLGGPRSPAHGLHLGRPARRRPRPSSAAGNAAAAPCWCCGGRLVHGVEEAE